MLSPNPDTFGFADVASAGTELRTVGTLTELPSLGVMLSPNLDEAGIAVELGVVLSPNPDEAGIAAELGGVAVTEP